MYMRITCDSNEIRAVNFHNKHLDVPPLWLCHQTKKTLNKGINWRMGIYVIPTNAVSVKWPKIQNTGSTAFDTISQVLSVYMAPMADAYNLGFSNPSILSLLPPPPLGYCFTTFSVESWQVLLRSKPQILVGESAGKPVSGGGVCTCTSSREQGFI